MNQEKSSLAVHGCVVAMYVFVALAIVAFAGGIVFNFTNTMVSVAGVELSVGDIFGIAFWPMILGFVIAAHRFRKLSPVNISSDWRTDVGRERE